MSPDLAAAKRYYDELMPILGLRAWFPTTKAGEFNYGPDSARGQVGSPGAGRPRLLLSAMMSA